MATSTMSREVVYLVQEASHVPLVLILELLDKLD